VGVVPVLVVNTSELDAEVTDQTSPLESKANPPRVEVPPLKPPLVKDPPDSLSLEVVPDAFSTQM
jgi:hypothetical protein